MSAGPFIQSNPATEYNNSQLPPHPNHRNESNRVGSERKSIVDQFKGSSYKDKYTVEKEDDIGQIQLASGGFGDAGALDEAALKQMLE